MPLRSQLYLDNLRPRDPWFTGWPMGALWCGVLPSKFGLSYPLKLRLLFLVCNASAQHSQFVGPFVSMTLLPVERPLSLARRTTGTMTSSQMGRCGCRWIHLLRPRRIPSCPGFEGPKPGVCGSASSPPASLCGSASSPHPLRAAQTGSSRVMRRGRHRARANHRVNPKP